MSAFAHADRFLGNAGVTPILGFHTFSGEWGGGGGGNWHITMQCEDETTVLVDEATLRENRIPENEHYNVAHAGETIVRVNSILDTRTQQCLHCHGRSLLVSDRSFCVVFLFRPCSHPCPLS